MAQMYVTEESGGLLSLYQSAAKPLAAVARLTDFQYLLGFYPSRVPEADEYRQLRIAVRRPGVSVFYRHGYVPANNATEDGSNVRGILVKRRTLRCLAMADDWGAAKIGFDRAREWIPVSSVSALPAHGPAGQDVVRVEIAFRPPHLTFLKQGDSFEDTLYVAVFVEDAGKKHVGEKWERLDLHFESDPQALLKGKELSHGMNVEVVGQPAVLKVVLLEYCSGRLRPVVLRLKTKS